MLGQMRPKVVEQAEREFNLHKAWLAPDFDALIDEIGGRVRAVAAGTGMRGVDAALIARLPKLEIIANFGVGYDDVDVEAAARRGIVVTNTPDVLNEEVADTAIGLLICTVRQMLQADRFVREGKWRQEPFPLGASLRDRTVGMVGLGRIGLAIARRLDAMLVPVVYHTRRPRPDVAYRHYPSLIEMARDVQVLLLILPGGAATRGLIDMEVLEALGPDGILINVARGSVVNENDLIEALERGVIAAAGLDVFENEPDVPARLAAMENVVLLPHIASATLHTRDEMGQLVIDNLLAWAQGKPPLTPVPETPWPPARG